MTFRINLKHVQSQINFEYLFSFLLFVFFIEDTKYGSGFIIWDNWVSFNPSSGSPLLWKPPRERILLPLDQPRLQLCLRNLWRADSKMITSCKMPTGQRGESGDLRRRTYLQSVQGVDPAEQPPRGEEPVQVHVLGVGALAVQAVAEVMELRLGQSRSRAQDHVLPGRRQVGIQAHVDPHSTQAEQDGHLDEALGEVLLQVQHGLGATSADARSVWDRPQL